MHRPADFGAGPAQGSLAGGGNHMYVIALVLLLGGIFLIGISFSIVPIQALVFVAGILCVAASLAIPFHFSGSASHR